MLWSWKSAFILFWGLPIGFVGFEYWPCYLDFLHLIILFLHCKYWSQHKIELSSVHNVKWVMELQYGNVQQFGLLGGHWVKTNSLGLHIKYIILLINMQCNFLCIFIIILKIKQYKNKTSSIFDLAFGKLVAMTGSMGVVAILSQFFGCSSEIFHLILLVMCSILDSSCSQISILPKNSNTNEEGVIEKQGIFSLGRQVL